MGIQESRTAEKISFFIFLYKNGIKRRERRLGIGLFYMLSVYLCTTAVHVERHVKRGKCKVNEREVVKSKGSKEIKTVLRQQAAWRYGETKAVDTPTVLQFIRLQWGCSDKAALFLFYIHRKQAREERAFSSNEQFK